MKTNFGQTAGPIRNFGTQLEAQKTELQTQKQQLVDQNVQAEAQKTHQTEIFKPATWFNKAQKISVTAKELEATRTQSFEKVSEQINQSEQILAPLGSLLSQLKDVSPASGLEFSELRGHYESLVDMFEAADSLQQAIEAAGEDIARDFPSEQLQTIQENLATEIDATSDRHTSIVQQRQQEREKAAKEAAAKRPRREVATQGGPPTKRARTEFEPRRFEPRPLATAKIVKGGDIKDADLTDQLAFTLGNNKIGEAAAKALESLKGGARTGLLNNLKAFTALADHAQHALDYATVGSAGFGSPRTRLDHQAWNYSGRLDGESIDRRQASTQELGKNLLKALEGGSPGKDVKNALIDGFIKEIGIPSHLAKDWKPTVTAVRKAIDGETLVPLRCLNETIGSVRGPYAPEDRHAMKAAVQRFSQAVVEGNIDEWKTNNPLSQRQLATLSDKAQAAWNKSLTIKSQGHGKSKLVSQEAEGTELLWATKVGGPSHGFDTMSQCVLSLLTNARTHAITVKDSEWHNYAARAYLRLFPTAEGKTMLYLDPVQSDFSYREHRRDADHSGKFEQAMVRHAVKKAQEMGVGLTFTRGYDRALFNLGLEGMMRRDQHTFILEPSAGVTEASDTLGMGHDWQQMDRQATRPLTMTTIRAKDIAQIKLD